MLSSSVSESTTNYTSFDFCVNEFNDFLRYKNLKTDRRLKWSLAWNMKNWWYKEFAETDDDEFLVRVDESIK